MDQDRGEIERAKADLAMTAALESRGTPDASLPVRAEASPSRTRVDAWRARLPRGKITRHRTPHGIIHVISVADEELQLPSAASRSTVHPGEGSKDSQAAARAGAAPANAGPQVGESWGSGRGAHPAVVSEAAPGRRGLLGVCAFPVRYLDDKDCLRTELTMAVVLCARTYMVRGFALEAESSPHGVREAVRMARLSLQELRRRYPLFPAHAPYPEPIDRIAVPTQRPDVLTAYARGLQVLGVGAEAMLASAERTRIDAFMDNMDATLWHYARHHNWKTHMTLEELHGVACVYLGGIYHNEVHPALGVTPREAWDAVSNRPPPSPPGRLLH